MKFSQTLYYQRGIFLDRMQVLEKLRSVEEVMMFQNLTCNQSSLSFEQRIMINFNTAEDQLD